MVGGFLNRQLSLSLPPRTITPQKSALRLESHDQAGVQNGWRNGRFRDRLQALVESPLACPPTLARKMRRMGHLAPWRQRSSLHEFHLVLQLKAGAGCTASDGRSVPGIAKAGEFALDTISVQKISRMNRRSDEFARCQCWGPNPARVRNYLVSPSNIQCDADPNIFEN